MKKLIIVFFLSALCLAFFSFMYPSRSGRQVPYPEGYRKWAHIKTAIVGPENPGFQLSGGFHHIYANEKAMEGYLTGNFPFGSVIVFDVIDARVQSNTDIEEGARKHIDVMVKDSLTFSATGGWGYEEFNGNSKTDRTLTPHRQANCAGCHAQKKTGVFSNYRQ
jgi:hypothetical protein